MNLQAVLQALYEAGIQTAMRDEWDAGWQLRMDVVIEPLVDLPNAARWFHEQALLRYPTSNYSANLSKVPKRQSGNELFLVLTALYNSFDRVGISSIPGQGWDVLFNNSMARVDPWQGL